MDQSTQLHGYLAVINLVANITELIGTICGLYLVCHAAFFEKFTLPIIDWSLNRTQQVLVGLMLIAIGFTTPFLWSLIPTGPEFEFSKDYDENKNQSLTPRFLKSKTTVREKESLFALIDKLENSLPFRYQIIAKLIDRPFIPATEFTNLDDSNIHVRTSEDLTRLLTQVWIREPSKFTEKDKGNMALDINTHLPVITIDEIIERFGKESSIDEETANEGPADRLVVNYNYERPWGMLTFQFRKQTHGLLYVILNTCENPFPCGGIVSQ